MSPLRQAIAATLCLALLAACEGEPRHQSPAAKTNPNPVERYAITVRLVDPPPDIQGISGVAHFGTDRGCLPYRERINRITISARYEHPFALEPIGDNTYRGHIYLDWPVDEDYYGLGVCHWKLHIAAVNIRYPNYIQKPDLWGSSDFPNGTRNWWCRRPESRRIIDNCTTPSDPLAIEKEQLDSYLVIMTASKDTP